MASVCVQSIHPQRINHPRGWRSLPMEQENAAARCSLTDSVPQPPNQDPRMFHLCHLTPVLLRLQAWSQPMAPPRTSDIQNKEQAPRFTRMCHRKALMEMQKSFAERLSEAQKARGRV